MRLERIELVRKRFGLIAILPISLAAASVRLYW